MTTFDLPGVLRKIRRMADLSQRELAVILQVGKSHVGRVESGTVGMDARVLAAAATLAGLRLVLVDGNGEEIAGMSDDSVRDMGGRRFPAHLDTRYSDEGWWHGPHRFEREQPWYTFDRRRDLRDEFRGWAGTPEDHQPPRPGDSPAQRALARRQERWRRRAEERERRFLAGEFAHVRESFVCTCPQECDELDDRSGKPVHAVACRCNCDLA